MYRRVRGEVEVLLVHPGGPYWRRKDSGAWSIPKGEGAPGEAPEAAARREFAEETGFPVEGKLRPLGRIRQKGGKLVDAFAVEGELDTAAISANTFLIEWPPRSGRQQSFSEIDRAEWFTIEAAHGKLLESQRPLLDLLVRLLSPGEKAGAQHDKNGQGTQMRAAGSAMQHDDDDGGR